MAGKGIDLGLTKKEQLFVKHYLDTWNPAEACRRAGYPGDQTALQAAGAKNLKNPAILKAIKAGKKEPVRYCKACDTLLVRRKKAGGELESLNVFKRRKYCNAKCARYRDRPEDWLLNHAKARKHKKAYCEACGIEESLHAHHVDGNPKNNRKQNIQTLCVWCHNFLHAVMERLKLDVPGRMPPLGHYE